MALMRRVGHGHRQTEVDIGGVVIVFGVGFQGWERVLDAENRVGHVGEVPVSKVGRDIGVYEALESWHTSEKSRISMRRLLTEVFFVRKRLNQKATSQPV